jgi:hypothetical protein
MCFEVCGWGEGAKSAVAVQHEEAFSYEAHECTVEHCQGV